VNDLLARLDDYIETHNKALSVAQKPTRYKNMEIDEEKIVAIIDKGLFINKNDIAPDVGVIEEHTAKLKKIFWNFE
jgi:signal transduction histidine kinase